MQKGNKQLGWIALQSYGFKQHSELCMKRLEKDCTVKMTKHFAHDGVLGKDISSQCSMNWKEPVSTGVT